MRADAPFDWQIECVVYPGRKVNETLPEFVETNGVKQTAGQRRQLLDFVASEYPADRSLRELAEHRGRTQTAIRRALDELETLAADGAQLPCESICRTRHGGASAATGRIERPSGIERRGAYREVDAVADALVHSAVQTEARDPAVPRVPLRRAVVAAENRT